MDRGLGAGGWGLVVGRPLSPQHLRPRSCATRCLVLEWSTQKSVRQVRGRLFIVRRLATFNQRRRSDMFNRVRSIAALVLIVGTLLMAGCGGGEVTTPVAAIPTVEPTSVSQAATAAANVAGTAVPAGG